MLNNSGEPVAGMVFPDGITTDALTEVHEFIYQATEHGLSVLDKTIEVHTSLLPSIDYHTIDEAILREVAACTDMSFNAFLNKGDNVDYYGVEANDSLPYRQKAA